jgi:hypothetical protein
MYNDVKYAKVEGHPNLLRDLSTNAIINTDSFSSDQYTVLKNKKKTEKNKIENIENELSELKSSIEEIKFLLKGIVNGS